MCSITGKIMQWNTILSLPTKCISRVSESFQYNSHVLLLSSAHCLVAEIYPMGASNQTYNTFPSASGSGTLIPHSPSRVMARGCRPPSIQLLHWPYTFVFQSLAWSRSNHVLNQGSYSFKGKYQCLVARNTGGCPL